MLCFLCLCRYERLHNEVTICLVGKYTSLEDAYTSVTKALRHAAVACNYKVNIEAGFVLLFWAYLVEMTCVFVILSH